MSVGANEYAILAGDSYNDRSKNVGKFSIELHGVNYKILDAKINSITGYQGTVYQKLDASGFPTGEVIIAHRGTEFDREPIRDGLTDYGMITVGLNAQVLEAEAFTKHAIELAKQTSGSVGKPPNITVTGHSLGGALAELTAYKFHLHGETFNAYGAAGLLHGIPEGGNQVINHVRATDVVSAASKHFGEVRVYATAQDIDRLSKAHYRDNGNGLRNMIGAIDPGAHGIANFIPDAQGHSAFDLENIVRYQDHHAMVNRFRQDVMMTRTVVSARWEVQKEVQQFAYEGGQMMAMASAARLLDTYQTARDASTKAVQYVSDAYDRAHDATARSTQAMNRSADYLAQSFGTWFESRPTAMQTPVQSDQSSQIGRVSSQEGQEAKRASEPVAPARSHAGEVISFSGRLDRMLAAADAGDWDQFTKDTAALANAPSARHMWTQAKMMAGLEDKLVAEHQAQLQHMQQQITQQQSAQYGRGMSR